MKKTEGLLIKSIQLLACFSGALYIFLYIVGILKGVSSLMFGMLLILLSLPQTNNK